MGDHTHPSVPIQYVLASLPRRSLAHAQFELSRRARAVSAASQMGVLVLQIKMFLIIKKNNLKTD